MTADEGLETVDRYMYLGLFKSNDRSCTKDHKVGISLAKQQMLQPERPDNNSQIETHRNISMASIGIWRCRFKVRSTRVRSMLHSSGSTNACYE